MPTSGMIVVPSRLVHHLEHPKESPKKSRRPFLLLLLLLPTSTMTTRTVMMVAMGSRLRYESLESIVSRQLPSSITIPIVDMRAEQGPITT